MNPSNIRVSAFEYHSNIENSHKRWEVSEVYYDEDQQVWLVDLAWGRCGEPMRSQRKAFADREGALKFRGNKLREKLAKGYLSAGLNGAVDASQERVAVRAEQEALAKPAPRVVDRKWKTEGSELKTKLARGRELFK